MTSRTELRRRTASFSARFNLKRPILLAPMAGACPPALSAAVAEAGGMGACGSLLMAPQAIRDWAEAFRNAGTASFQVNNWIPDSVPVRNASHERDVVRFLRNWHADVPGQADLSKAISFQDQCQAMLEAEPTAVSSIMGLYSEAYVAQLKARSIAWIAVATTVAEAREAQARGADAIVAQGMEAGGHRGTFNPRRAEAAMTGLFALIPAVVDNVDVPVIAAGGIADSRGIAAAICLGASAVQIGTGFLRCPESGIPSAWSDAIGSAYPDDTVVTKAFSGRPGRSIRTAYAVNAAAPDAPDPVPYPIQRVLTAPMTGSARERNDLDRMQAWTGQSAHLAKALPASELTRALWRGASDLLFGGPAEDAHGQS